MEEVKGATMAKPRELEKGVGLTNLKAVDLTKKDNKTYNCVLFMTHMASTCHTLKDTKEAYIVAVSLKLGEFAPDARQAIQRDTPIVFTNPERLQLQ